MLVGVFCFPSPLPAAATRFPVRSHQCGACSAHQSSSNTIKRSGVELLGLSVCQPEFGLKLIVELLVSSKAFSFGYLIVSLSWILCKKIIIFTIVTPLIPWPLFKVQRLEGIWVQSLSRGMFVCWATLTYESFIQIIQKSKHLIQEKKQCCLQTYQET